MVDWLRGSEKRTFFERKQVKYQKEWERKNRMEKNEYAMDKNRLNKDIIMWNWRKKTHELIDSHSQPEIKQRLTLPVPSHFTNYPTFWGYQDDIVK